MTFALAAAAAGLIVAVLVTIAVQWRRRPGRMPVVDNSWVEYVDALTKATRLPHAA